LLNKHVLLVNLQGLYPDHHTYVEVSSGDDDVLKIDASAADPRVPTGDEAEGEGISSVESIASGPIRSNTSAQADSSVANRVISSTPSAGKQSTACSQTQTIKVYDRLGDNSNQASSIPQTSTSFGFSRYRDYFLGVSKVF
jgi:hypothetical protein